MTPVITYRQNGLYSAATSAGLLCFQAPRASAVAAITAIGVSIADANAALDSPIDAPTWRATWTAAVSEEIGDIGAEISALSDADRADKISERLAAAMAMLAEIHAQQIEANKLQAEANASRERIARQLSEQEKHKAAEAERKRWIDVRVERDGDTVKVWREITEHVGNVGPNREPDIRHYSKLITHYPADKAPADVLARVGVKPERSKLVMR